MSLKAFHVVFVTLSIALSVGFSIWALREYLDNRGAVFLGVVIGSIGFAVVLTYYGAWFLRKLRDVPFL